MSKLTICIDFDGVIHTYDKGWLDGSIYGDVTPGFFEWALEAAKTFRLVIHSSRDMNDIRDWMVEKSNEWCKKQNPTLIGPIPFEYSRTKPPAFISIDDRALTFTGDWGEFHPEGLLNFSPWNKKK